MAKWEWVFPAKRYIRLQEEPRWCGVIVSALSSVLFFAVLSTVAEFQTELYERLFTYRPVACLDDFHDPWYGYMIRGVLSGLLFFVPVTALMATDMLLDRNWTSRRRLRRKLVVQVVARMLFLGAVAIIVSTTVQARADGNGAAHLIAMAICAIFLIRLLLLSQGHMQEVGRQVSVTPLCANCGYALVGLVTPRCPECGRDFDPKLLEGYSPEDAAAALAADRDEVRS